MATTAATFSLDQREALRKYFYDHKVLSVGKAQEGAIGEIAKEIGSTTKKVKVLYM